MNNFRYIGFIYLFAICFNSVAQTYTYNEKRDWVVGHYEGFSKDSTANSSWGSAVVDIYYSSDYDSLDDSTIVCTYINSQHVISDDSTFLFQTGQLDPNNSGKLNADSTINYWAYYPVQMVGHLFWFKGKLVQSYVGLKNQLKESLSINLYPNPSPDYINVSFNNNQIFKNLTWDITDITRKQILNGVFMLPSLKINTKEFMAGVYFLNIKSKEGVVYKKFVVQH